MITSFINIKNRNIVTLLWLWLHLEKCKVSCPNPRRQADEYLNVTHKLVVKCWHCRSHDRLIRLRFSALSISNARHRTRPCIFRTLWLFWDRMWAIHYWSCASLGKRSISLPHNNKCWINMAVQKKTWIFIEPEELAEFSVNYSHKVN